MAAIFNQQSTLEQILEQGKLVVASRNSPTTYYEGTNGPAGFEYELAKLFAAHLGVRLHMVVPESLTQLFQEVEQKKAHLAAAGLSILPSRLEHFQFGPSYQTISQYLIYNVNHKRPKNLANLTDGNLEIMAHSSHEATLIKQKDKYPLLIWKPNTQVESEELLKMVADELIDYTIADSNEFWLNQRFLIDLRVAFEVGEKQKIAWLLPKSDDNSLRAEVEKFFTEIRQNSDLNLLLERTYGHVKSFDYVGTKIFMRHVGTRLPEYIDFFKASAKQNQLDWMLLAAMAYQESHWDAAAVSPTGVKGLMMLTSKTAKDLKIKNRVDPQSSIKGGALYLRQMLDLIDNDVAEPDRTWMAMAAYNVGFYHLKDAKEIAKKLKLNPSYWLDVKKTLPLLAKKKWHEHTRYGYARGWEPVRYVENIRRYYDVLTWLNRDDDEVADQPTKKNIITPKVL